MRQNNVMYCYARQEAPAGSWTKGSVVETVRGQRRSDLSWALVWISADITAVHSCNITESDLLCITTPALTLGVRV